MSENITQLLEQHWALDPMAAEMMAERIPISGGEDHLRSVVEPFSNEAIEARDRFRQELGMVFDGTSDKKLMVLGPCSLDEGVDYAPLFELIEQLQAERPDVLFAMRANHSKPRSARGWRGSYNSLDLGMRQMAFDVMRQAVDRRIPVLTEITGNTQLGAFAPYLSGAWAGARDMTSTELRGLFSGVHIPIGVKNDPTGEAEVVEQAVTTIRSNSAENDNSGFMMGTIASTVEHLGFPTGILGNESGNPHVAIFARGHKVHRLASPEEQNEAALQHISTMTDIAHKLGSVVILDGSHDVPKMFAINRKDGDRFQRVMKVIVPAILEGNITNADLIRGTLCEIGPEVGRTDPNSPITAHTKAEMLDIVDMLGKVAES